MPRSNSRSATFLKDIGLRPYVTTTSQIISRELSKIQNGFFICGVQPCASSAAIVGLTVPVAQ